MRNTSQNRLFVLPLFQVHKYASTQLLSSNLFTETISEAPDAKEDAENNIKITGGSGMTSRSIHGLMFFSMILGFHKSGVNLLVNFIQPLRQHHTNSKPG